MYESPSSQSALFIITASVGPSPKVRNCENTRSMPSRLAAIRSSESSWRESSLPEGSPTLVVPPPMSTIGLCPVRCHQRSSMMGISEPTCRLSAVQSKPI